MANDQKVSIRLPQDLLDRIDALKPLLAADSTLGIHGDITRAHVMRLALLRGLESLEDRLAPGWTLSDDEGAIADSDIFGNPFATSDSADDPFANLPALPIEPPSGFAEFTDDTTDDAATDGE